MTSTCSVCTLGSYNWWYMHIEYFDGIPVIIGPRPTQIIPDGERFRPLRRKRRKGQPLAVLNEEELNDLTIQQNQALKNYFSGMTKNKAAKMAGFKGSGPGVVNRALETVVGNQALRDAMEELELTPKHMMQVLKDGLDAKHPFKPDEKDQHAIHKFFQDGIKILDGYPASKLNVKGDVDHRHVHIHLTRKDDEQAERFAKMRGIDIEAEAIQEP